MEMRQFYLDPLKVFQFQVRHAVQGWILDPRLNLGLEVEGDVEIGQATLHINTKVGILCSKRRFLNFGIAKIGLPQMLLHR